MIDTVSLERRLGSKWGAIPGVYSVRVRPHRGVWSIIVSGPGDKPPRGIPVHVQVDVGERFPKLLPVFWNRVQRASPQNLTPAVSARNMKPANEMMWSGVPPVTERPVDLFNPRRSYEVATTKPNKIAKLDEFQIYLPARTPELPFWSNPYDNEQCICISAYNVLVPGWNDVTNATQQLTVRGISYTGYGIPAGSYVRFRVARSGDEQATWDDVMMAPSGNPSNQFAFGSPISPLPMNLLVDHDQTLSVNVQLLGPPPFNIQPGYAVNAQICVEVHGWMSWNNDARNGWPRPQDLGDLNDVAQGYFDIIDDFKDGDLVHAVDRVINSGAYELKHPERGGLR